MRINRGKAIRKYLRFYRIVYGLESPYHAILDGNFIYYALKFKVDIQDRLRVQLQVTGGEMVRLFITKSSLAELKAVPEGKAANAIAFATRFCEVLDDDDCGTEKDSTAAARLTEFLWRAHRGWINGPQSATHKGAGGSNTKAGGAAGPGPAPTHGFFVASQDVGLRRALAAIPGTPLVYLNNVAFVMEAPSDASKTFNKALEGSKVSALADSETALLDSMKRKRKRDGGGGGDGESGGHIVGTVGASAGAEEEKEEEGGTQAKQQRTKHRAKSANPLASKRPTPGSAKQKKAKAGKFRK